MRGFWSGRKIVTSFVALGFVVSGASAASGAPAASWHPAALKSNGSEGIRARPSPLHAASLIGTPQRAPGSNAGAAQPAKAEPPSAVTGKLRDPFKAPEPPPSASAKKSKVSHIPSVLPPGTRGLLIDRLVLEGVVDKKPDNTMIAVVTNKSNRAYFLRVNAQVFDGIVTLITPTAIYFRQHYFTADDKSEWRTVEKRLSAGPEGAK
jgi:hypothetical protein